MTHKYLASPFKIQSPRPLATADVIINFDRNLCSVLYFTFTSFPFNNSEFPFWFIERATCPPRGSSYCWDDNWLYAPLLSPCEKFRCYLMTSLRNVVEYPTIRRQLNYTCIEIHGNCRRKMKIGGFQWHRSKCCRLDISEWLWTGRDGMRPLISCEDIC